MHKIIKGSEIDEFSAYATMINVKLDAWGGPPESDALMRCSGTGSHFVCVRLRDRLSTKATDALRNITDFMHTIGYKQIWYGLPFPDPQLQEHIATVGFRPAGRYFRLYKDLGPSDLSVNTKVSFDPVDATPEQFTEFFDGTRSGSPNIEWNLGRNSSLGIFLHELITPNWRENYFTARVEGKAVGVVTMADTIDMQRRPTLILCPFLKKTSWTNGEAEAVLRAGFALAQSKGLQRATVTAEESETERLQFYESLGLKRENEYVHFLRTF